MIPTPWRVSKHVFAVLPLILSGALSLNVWCAVMDPPATPIPPRDEQGKKDDSFFLSFISTILITILAAAILVVFYRYAVKYIPSDTIRIPLKVFSRVNPDGMIRLPTSDEEAVRIGETFPDSDDESERLRNDDNHFRDEDDDIPPPVKAPANLKKIKMTENEQDFFDVSDGEDEEDEPEGREVHGDEATTAWGH